MSAKWTVKILNRKTHAYKGARASAQVLSEGTYSGVVTDCAMMAEKAKASRHMTGGFRFGSGYTICKGARWASATVVMTSGTLPTIPNARNDSKRTFVVVITIIKTILVDRTLNTKMSAAALLRLGAFVPDVTYVSHRFHGEFRFLALCPCSIGFITPIL